MKREKMKNFLIKIIRFPFLFTIIFSFLIGDIVFPKELTEKKIKIKEVYGKLPIYFIENYGQIDEKKLKKYMENYQFILLKTMDKLMKK